MKKWVASKLSCDKCKWEHMYTTEEISNLGLPWYCVDCGERVYKFVRYEKEDLK